MNFDAGDLVGFGATAAAFFAFIKFFLAKQIDGLRDDVRTLRQEVADLREENEVHRSEKHGLRTELAIAAMLLMFVEHAECTCGAITSRIQQMIRDLLRRSQDAGIIPTPTETP